MTTRSANGRRADRRWPRAVFAVRAATLLGVMAALLIGPGEARAQTRTWTGLGADSNWSTPENWQGGVPTTGSTVVFPAGAARMTNNNNLPGLSINSLTISGSGYIIGGNALTITNAPGIELTVAGTATLSMNVTLSTELVQVASGGTLTLSGVITAMFLDKRDPGTLVLSNQNAIGDIGSQTNCGVIRALHAQALGPTSGGVVTLRDNCTLRIEANTTLEKQFILRGDGAPGTTGVLEVEKGVVVALRIDLQNVSPATISVFAGGTLDVLPLPTAIQLQSSLTMNVAGTATIARSLVGNNDLIKTNSGVLVLTDTNTFTGQTIIRGGTVFINGRQEGSPVSLEGGTVAGTGSAGTITATATGREISPGVAGPPGTLNSRDVSMNGATTFTVQVNGAQSDQLNVVGTVALTNAQLRVTGTLPAGPVVIINNDGSDLVSGIFAGLSEGATVMVNGGAATISYIGGDGNDVVLNPRAVVPPITLSPAKLPNGTVGVPYSQTVTASGGVGQPFMGAVTGQLPPGLTAAALMKGVSGSISGTPTQAGTFTFTLTATDAAKNVGSQTYEVTIDAPPPIVISPATLPNGTVGVTYSQIVTATGGVGQPYMGAATGELPPGLTAVVLVKGVSASISGTPTQAGTFTFTLTATDAAKNVGSQTYEVTIDAPPPIVISPTTLPNGTVGVAYSQIVTATGGVGQPYMGAATGDLPPGLTAVVLVKGVSASVSGTPTQPGTFTFTLTATDAAKNVGSQEYTVTITTQPAPVTITIAPPTLPNGTVGTAYTQTITASGGTGPYTFATTSGAVPPGLALSSAGVLSGTPTTPGPFSFTVTATDAAGNMGTHTYTIAIVATPVPVLPWWVLAALTYFALRIAASRLRSRQS